MASVQSTGKAGFKDKLKVNILKEMQAKGTREEDIQKYYVLKVQKAWRARQSRVFVSALKQESTCRAHRNDNPFIKRGVNGAPDEIQIVGCVACGEGEVAATVQQKITRKQYQDVQKLLFWGQPKMTVDDTGDNWNQRFQRAIDLPEASIDEKIEKYQTLSAINKDFVSSATRYAKTIISEYFLHVKDKSIRSKNFGGFAGGQKYLWRGILFKMSDGSSGPWNGSDEAAAKAAGHDMKSVVHYFESGVRDLRFPLMALIDYRGFRMTAQAYLPLGPNSLRYGSSDAGRTIHKDDPTMNELIKQAAEILNIRSHAVGSSSSSVLASAAEIDSKTLHAAVDIEGHIGMDGRYYMLDLARSFPPESVTATQHLADLHEDGTSVLVFIPPSSVGGQEVSSKVLMGTIYKAYVEGKFYDILLETGKVLFRHPSEYIRARTLSIFWRLLRPEYVRYRGNNTVALVAHNNIDSKEGLSLVKALSGGVATDAVDHVVSYFDVVAPALAEMSAAVDNVSTTNVTAAENLSESTISPNTAFINSTANNSSDSAYDDFVPEVNSLAAPISQIADVDALYDDFNPEQRMWDASTPTALDLGYDEFLSTKIGLQLDTLSIQAESGNDKTRGAYGAYDDFDEISANIQGDLLLHPDAVINGEGPLSPDAGSAFSRADPYAAARNEEVRLATLKLLNVVIPAAADELCALPLSDLQDLDLAVFLHNRGINMRHLGYLRSCIPATKSNFGSRLKLLVEITSRTLKNLLRDFQRRWMRSERSTSEEGMLNLITQFLNLIVGSNVNSAEFWEERVVIGMIQRFGRCVWFYKETEASVKKVPSAAEILTEIEYLRSSPQFLHSLLPRFLSMMGLVLDHLALNLFLVDKKPYMFEFMPADIFEYEPRVKCMHIVNFGIGTALQYDAENRIANGKSDSRIIGRMIRASKKHYELAQTSLPANLETKERLQVVSDMMMTPTPEELVLGDITKEAIGSFPKFSAPPMKAGTLKKDGPGFFFSWTTRHFVLLDGKLTYYEKPSANPPYGISEKGSTDLSNMKISQVPGIAQFRMKLEHGADPKCRSYTLEAIDQQELDTWMAAIDEHIKFATGH